MELREKFEAADADGGDSLDQDEVSSGAEFKKLQSTSLNVNFRVVFGQFQGRHWKGDE